MPRIKWVEPPVAAPDPSPPGSLAAFLGPPRKAPKKKSVRGIGDAQFTKLLDEVAELGAQGRWKEATGKHFVALYAELHFKVYGVAAVDLDPKTRVYAAKMAGDMLANDFAGDGVGMASFIAWSWTQEKDREQWRRDNPTLSRGGRLTWRWQFGRGALSTFRVEEARKKAGSR